MDFTFTPAEDRFRDEVRSWLQTHLTHEYRSMDRSAMEDPEQWKLRLAWERELADGRWIGLPWPAQFGGRALTLNERLIFDEEYVEAGAPNRAGFFGEQLLGPTMIVHGTEAQKQRFLPRILRGEEIWCQGYSEPGAGSDLANVSTAAVLDGDEWVITGQKVWTSLAQFADWIFVLCRTDSSAPKHRGLSLLLCPLEQPGIEIRPIRQITGGSEFNEVFFDGARTSAANVLGPVDGGWKVAMSVLGFERGTAFLAMQRAFARELTETTDIARGRGLLDEGSVRDRLADAWIGLQVMRFMGLRTVSAFNAGRMPGPEASVGKLFWSHWHQHLGELAMELGGPASTVLEHGRLSDLQHSFLFSKQDTIAAGSSEIQRNVLAERVLGLP